MTQHKWQYVPGQDVTLNGMSFKIYCCLVCGITVDSSEGEPVYTELCNNWYNDCDLVVISKIHDT